MTNSRRTFLRDLSRSAFAAGFLLAGARAGLAQSSSNIPAQTQNDPVLLFTASTFAPYVGDIFSAPNSRGESVELRLDQVKKYEAKNRLTSRAQSTESFTLVFKASAELPPLTSIHEISHPRLGKFDLFLTRYKNDKGELFYEAVINHLQ
jgi:hypothetical protein